MTIADLIIFLTEVQSKIDEKFGKNATKAESVLATMTKISEEVGELAEQVMLRRNRQRSEKGIFEKEVMAAEIADVILATTMMACEMDIDLTVAIEKKMEKIGERFNV